MRDFCLLWCGSTAESGLIIQRCTNKIGKSSLSPFILPVTLYEAHKKETQIEANGGSLLQIFTEQLSKYEDTNEETGSIEEAKLAVLAAQMGINIEKALLVL